MSGFQRPMRITPVKPFFPEQTMTKSILRSAALLLGATVLLIQTAAFAQERIRFDIPAQALATALRLFQTQSGAAVLYSPELVANKQAAAVPGN